MHDKYRIAQGFGGSTHPDILAEKLWQMMTTNHYY